MKTKLIILLILFLLFSAQAFALDRVVDNAGVLSESQKSELLGLADYIASKYKFDLVIVTETEIGNTSPAAYANNFYDDNGYGADGCLFLRVMGTRDYWFSTTGSGIKILNSFAGQKLDSDTGKYLGANDYHAAFSAFIEDWDLFLGLSAKGRSYNFFYQWNLVLMIIVWLVALGIGLAVVAVWKKGMNTAMPQTQAAAYVVAGSLNFTVKKESFLYSSTNKIKKASSSTGSSIAKGLVGSSGRSHGGRGGRR